MLATFWYVLGLGVGGGGGHSLGLALAFDPLWLINWLQWKSQLCVCNKEKQIPKIGLYFIAI